MKKMLSWNVNGLRAIYKKGFIEWLGKESPDILALQETKSHIEQLPSDLVNIEGYKSYFSSGERNGYSGVAVYTKVEPLEVLTKLGNPKYDSEGRVLILKFKTFTFVNIYYPNGKSGQARLDYKLGFYQAFIDYLKQHDQENYIICGDVNTAHTEIDLARPKENSKISGFLPIEREFLDKFLQLDLVDSLRQFNKSPGLYTWWDQKSRARERNVGWRIDYFYVSKSLQANLKNAFILSEVVGSDHCPIGIDINL